MPGTKAIFYTPSLKGRTCAPSEAMANLVQAFEDMKVAYVDSQLRGAVSEATMPLPHDESNKGNMADYFAIFILTTLGVPPSRYGRLFIGIFERPLVAFESNDMDFTVADNVDIRNLDGVFSLVSPQLASLDMSEFRNIEIGENDSVSDVLWKNGLLPTQRTYAQLQYLISLHPHTRPIKESDEQLNNERRLWKFRIDATRDRVLLECEHPFISSRNLSHLKKNLLKVRPGTFVGRIQYCNACHQYRYCEHNVNSNQWHCYSRKHFVNDVKLRPAINANDMFLDPVFHREESMELDQASVPRNVVEIARIAQYGISDTVAASKLAVNAIKESPKAFSSAGIAALSYMCRNISDDIATVAETLKTQGMLPILMNIFVDRGSSQCSVRDCLYIYIELAKICNLDNAYVLDLVKARKSDGDDTCTEAFEFAVNVLMGAREKKVGDNYPAEPIRLPRSASSSDVYSQLLLCRLPWIRLLSSLVLEAYPAKLADKDKWVIVLFSQYTAMYGFDIHAFYSVKSLHSGQISIDVVHINDRERPKEFTYSGPELTLEHKVIALAVKSLFDSLLGRFGITGITASGYRLKDKAAKFCPEQCIVVFVRAKGLLPFGEKLLPTSWKGYKVDVREMRFHRTNSTVAYSWGPQQKLQIGACIGACYDKDNDRASIGSICLFVESKKGGDVVRGFLTAGHVVESKDQVWHPVKYPPFPSSLPKNEYTTRPIADLGRASKSAVYPPMSFSNDNAREFLNKCTKEYVSIDAAFCALVPDESGSNQLFSVPAEELSKLYRRPAPSFKYDIDEMIILSAGDDNRVFKVGPMTGLTEGKLNYSGGSFFTDWTVSIPSDSIRFSSDECFPMANQISYSGDRAPGLGLCSIKCSARRMEYTVG